GLTVRAAARADQDVVRVARLDRDPRDRAVVGGCERARHEGPRLALVGRLVQAEARLAVAAAVRLAGADAERLPARVVRVDGDRADRVRRDSGRDLLPLQVVLQRVPRAPDAAACGADVERAARGAALRADRHSRDAPRPLRRLDEGLRAEPVDVERVGPQRLPAVLVLRALLLELGVRLDRALDLVHRDRLGGIGPVAVLLGSGAFGLAVA